MAKRTTAKRRAEAKQPEDAPQPQISYPGTRDAALGEQIIFRSKWQLQVQLDDGTWDLYGMPTQDRDALQRTQDFRARKYPEERRRVLKHIEMWIVEDIEEPGRDPGPLPETDGNVPESSQEIIGAMARRIKETRN